MLFLDATTVNSTIFATIEPGNAIALVAPLPLTFVAVVVVAVIVHVLFMKPPGVDVGFAHAAVVPLVACKICPAVGAVPDTVTALIKLARTVLVASLITLFVNVCASVVPTNTPAGAAFVVVTAPVPAPISTLPLVSVVAPVPPFATANVPVTLVMLGVAHAAVTPFVATSV